MRRPRHHFEPRPGLRLRLGVAAVVVAAALMSAPSSAPADVSAATQSYFADGLFTLDVTQGRFLRALNDDQGYVTWQMGALKQQPAPTAVQIYMTGGSGVRESVSSAGDLENAIRAATGVSTGVHMLASSQQCYAETLALIDNLPESPGILVIGIHHTRFCYGYGGAYAELRGHEYLLRSPSLQAFVSSFMGAPAVNDLTIGIQEYVNGYAWRRHAAAFTGPSITYRQHRYTPAMIMSHADKVGRVSLWVNNRGRPGGPFYRYFDFNARLLEECVRQARRRGLQVALVEDPQDRAIVGHAFDIYKDKYDVVCRQLAAEYDCLFIDPNTTAGLVDNDFRDLIHIVASGRDKWTPALGRLLGPTVSHLDAAASGPLIPPAPSIEPSQAP